MLESGGTGGPYGGTSHVPAPSGSTHSLAVAQGGLKPPPSGLDQGKSFSDLAASGIKTYGAAKKAFAGKSDATPAAGLAAKDANYADSMEPGMPAAPDVTPPPESDFSIGAPDAAMARGGLADGGMPYSGEGIDIPDTAPDAKLITAGSPPKPKDNSGLAGMLVGKLPAAIGSAEGLFGGAGAGGATAMAGGADAAMEMLPEIAMLANRGGRAGYADGGGPTDDSGVPSDVTGQPGEEPESVFKAASRKYINGPIDAVGRTIKQIFTEKPAETAQIAAQKDAERALNNQRYFTPTTAAQKVDDQNAVDTTRQRALDLMPAASGNTPASSPAPAPGLAPPAAAAAAPPPAVHRRPAVAPPAPATPSPGLAGAQPQDSAFASPLDNPADTRGPQVGGTTGSAQAVPLGAPMPENAGLAAAQPAPAAARPAPVSTPAATPAGAEAPSGGLKGKLKSVWDGIKSADSDTLQGAIPLLTGLAAMGTAPTRSLGVALSAGLGAGANSYMQTRQNIADTAQTRATTGLTQEEQNIAQQRAAQIAAGNATTGAFFRDSAGAPMVRLYNGTQIPEIQWRDQGFPATFGAAQAQAAVNRNPGVKIPRAPAPTAVPAPAPTLLSPSSDAKASIESDIHANQQTPGMWPKYQQDTADDEASLRTSADSARNQGTQLVNFAREISKYNDGDFLQPGPLASAKATALGYLNDLVRSAGHPDLQVNPEGLDQKAIADKIANTLKFATTVDAGQHSEAALEAAHYANPNTTLTRAQALEMTTNLMVEKQRAIDLQHFEENARTAASDKMTYRSTAARNAFRNQFSDQYYQREKEQLRGLLGNSKLMEAAATGRLSPEDQKTFESMPISRYIYNR